MPGAPRHVRSGARADPPRGSAQPEAGCAAIARLREETGISMLLVEQNANQAFSVVDSAVVLETGRSVLTGSTAELRGNDEIRRAYLGG